MIINLSKIDFGGVAKSGGGNAKPEEVFDVQPTTSDQTITPSEGSVFSGGTVRAVTSAIDNNIAAGNIKEGVTILGVGGTLKEEKPEEVFDVQPTTSEQTITPTEGSVFSGGTVHAVTSSIDSNIQPENIKEGVSILGVAGTLSEGITPAGTIAINLNGTYDVTNYASAEVNVGDTPDYRYAKGTVDRAGLKAIGWTDEDILTYEQNNSHYPWQNDQYKVSDENKALYSLDDPNPESYKDNPNVTFVPNKNMGSYFTKSMGFSGMKYIKGIPSYDTSNMNSTYLLFSSCAKLTTIPNLDTSNTTDFAGMFQNCTNLITIPSLDTSKANRVPSMFKGCISLTTIPSLDTSNATDLSNMFSDCTNLKIIPRLDTSKATNLKSMLSGCPSLTTVEGIDFSGLTSNLIEFFGTSSTRIPNLTRFIVNGKINVSISDNYSIKKLIAIDYDSVKSILAAADRTDNTNAKTLAFYRTMTDQNGELAALVASCTSKGWTITGLTLN